MNIITSVIMAISLCADCLAVSICSSVSVGKISRTHIIRVAIAFAVIQTALLVAGWAFGNLFAYLVQKVAHIIGFLLLAYVGGSMLVEGVRGKSDTLNLNGMRNVILGGLATSIDALAVGVSQSFAGVVIADFLPLIISVFVITAASVCIGIPCGRTLGNRFGHWAEIAGGIVLILIGINLLI